jgi:hypothetical protein
MISHLLDDARARAQMADAVAKTDESITLRLREGEVVAAQTSEQAGHHLRLVVDGRIGVAGTTGTDAAALFEAAMASAAAGEEAPLLLPGPSPLPRVQTHVPRAAVAGVVELTQLGRLLSDRLRKGGRSITVHVERSVGSVRVGNTGGVDAEYQVTLVSLDIDVVSTAGTIAYGSWATSPAPTCLARPRLRAHCRPGAATHLGREVCRGPCDDRSGAAASRGAPHLLAPVQQALVGKAFLLGFAARGQSRRAGAAPESLPHGRPTASRAARVPAGGR